MKAVTLEDGLKILRSRVFKRYWDRVDWEDLFQEASVAFWQEYTKNSEISHCFKSADWRIKNLLSDNSRATLTGQPKRTPGKMKNSRGEGTRKRVKAYIAEYVKEHGSNPTVYRISKDLGVSTSSIHSALSSLSVKDGNTPREPKVVYLVDINDAETDDPTMQKARQDLQEAIAIPSHEVTALDRYIVKKFLLDLNPTEKVFIYRVYWECYSKAEAARSVGIANHNASNFHNAIMKGFHRKAEDMNYGIFV